MKKSIAITLIIIVGIFGFVSGYSIGYKNGQAKTGAGYSSESTGSEADSGGYGAPATGGYGAPATGGYGR